ncbi:multifunctional oxoglutarate decarboxylase/oxoglutarate dehydrogenase thiamine pyrophosphate-binding subunit/dihydrolipoyllysine-residue succinyltransferase subunit [Aquiluna sp. KACHI24]|uniref:multifunctional oxoglutarate decarboxylase/oxoglutarate dehydrogenase thiamine pyrophosphate-binding subunit/dihydrolipoyllysine-residue succinyltransferase subunit n=1 Tax=Aquiluna sp. KACHI24 TaxID=2968831 RepID=UPI0021FF7368|nr:multifunctional oxoglutarate decarboxylase/oxoglutarate dehydrogenase thiamine pyrophosphate-binding subunit/dihydrolipoyllysine-residue succinyltransferase subunit [Aquiluna sp. KACHI24]BDQ00576.1 alpha-ketoglutarate decarboxylase [Aquiluna sp. KACHI24]
MADNLNSDSGFGANEWLVAEMYTQWLQNPDSVDKSWWPILERYQQTQGSSPVPAPAAQPVPTPIAAPVVQTPTEAITIPVAKATESAPKAAPVPANLPAQTGAITTSAETEAEPEVTILKGMAKTLASNMDASLSIPTATSVRQVPAKLLIDNRIVINSHLKRTRGGKVSFTHLIGYAVVQALKEFPSQNVFYDEVDGKPAMVTPPHINFGLAIDIPKPDGTRALLVPNIKRAETLNFAEFVAAYESLVKRARDNKLTAEDFQGTTISLTNPGGIGTVHSVPRLTRGQGCIVGVGALDYPAQFQGMAEELLAEQGVGKILTLTSTYDHRVIQGAGSGEFLKIINELLLGDRGFYDQIFADMRIPYTPVVWVQDFHWDLADQNGKNTRIQEYINAFRVRGHLIADIDPLEYQQRWHPDLDIRSYGLSLWDLDRTFKTGGFGGRTKAKFRNMLGILRDSYCRTVGVEYMQIQNPEERRWFQDKLERPYVKPSKEEQFRILQKLNEAEAFETFLQTKFVGQKRFSLEGGESLIPALDQILQDAADSDLHEVAIAMAHRGRLNVLTNVAGKTYGQVFKEFEGSMDTKGVQGSGDVKYHLGTEGVFTNHSGKQVRVSLAANPSHLEAVNPVLEGIVRAKQDRLGNPENYPVVPVLIHGDAAFAGQGVVPETLQMSQLEGYKVGGTIHIVVNNQVGFTTLPKDSRSTTYATDIAKAIQAPIFHVNGDDPEAVVRVSRIAFEYRQLFNKDVVIDIVCYRRRGHNEGDDPSMTQPLMYNLIEHKRSVRTLYMENLIGRGDITQEEFDQANQSFQATLEKAFVDVHEAMSAPAELPTRPAGIGTTASEKQEISKPTAVAKEVVEAIGNAHANQPAGFAVHPKLAQLLEKRVEMSRQGGIDWGFGELLAFGSLLLEGVNVRLAGQDARRGTFVQRHASFHDRNTGQEWMPLQYISENQAKFQVFNSLLSEYAAMGFEYGYSVEEPNGLTLWEAQFGDFVNGAQTVVDEFISSAEQKWGQHASLVLLLPHGYEGQGPDHSSARIERFLQLCAENNMTVAQPSTPASHFHLLRRQAFASPKRPLIVFTPKSMLRLKAASSAVEDFTQGSFRPVINDEQGLNPANVKRVIFCSGKIYWDLLAESQKRGTQDTAIVRIEQLYPTPVEEMKQAIAMYPDAELVWVQDEPANQGPWTYMGLFMPKYGINFRNISRPASASPASGSAKRHATEQADLVQRAFEA